MASTLELLDTIDTQAEENVCIVDAVNRTISVPESLRLLGVESDEKAEIRMFRCPKIVGNNIDLTALILFINFENAGGQKGAYRIKDVEEEGDGTNITFSWELERKVTAYQGSPKFSLCAQRVKSGDDGTLEQEWNTTFNTECEVLEGLEVQESIEEEETAALTQIWQKIDELELAISGGGSGTPGSGISTSAKKLLLTILKNALYASDQSQNIKNLQTEFGITDDTYSIVYDLGNGISCTNSQTEINNGESYYTQIISDEGYSISSVIVEMAGNDITEFSYFDGSINIESVSGNIKITVESVADSIQENMFDPETTTDGYYCELTTGNLIQNTYRSVSDYIQVIGGKKYRIETSSDNSYVTSSDCIVMFDLDKTYKNFKAYRVSAGSPALLYTTIEPDSDSYIRINLYTKYKDSTVVKEVKE